MRVYLHGYTQRWRGIVVAIVCIIATIILSFALFYGQLYGISGQLRYYHDSDYTNIYILNYSSQLENECIYPDVDICFYKDPGKKERIAVSAIMKDEKADYTLGCIAKLSGISKKDMILSKNVARQYKLSIGSTVYADVPYAAAMIEYTVTDISDIVYDYSNPSISNDIGVVFIGYDKEYEDSIQCKYILFSKSSEVQRLAAFPQIIDEIISKSSQYDNVYRQGFVLLLFQIGFGVIPILAAHKVFFAQSRNKLVKCYLKGMRHCSIIVLPIIEKVILGLLVCAGVEFLCFEQVSVSSISILYFMIPCLIWLVYCVVSLASDIKYMGRRA